MPWSETTPMDERLQFVADVRRETEEIAVLCRRYGISRKTGYKWLARYAEAGPGGLADRSHRTHACPHATDPGAVDALCELRRRHPTWGPKKLLAVLARRRPALALPASSTAAALLKRAGLVTAPRRRRAPGHPGRPTAPMDAPNAVWTADFKGEFRTRDGAHCYPLTVADGYSRYLLACRALPSTATAGARPVFERLFRDRGLPARIRSDNGVPFATVALGRLSALSVWWVRLGVLPDLIEPASPQQNGRHERMHRTLKAEATKPPEAHARAQQRRFDAFRAEYNDARPHEALGQATPASRYRPSPRPYPTRLPPLEYAAHCEVRRVSRNGGIRWRNHWVNASHVLAEEYVALEELDDGVWSVAFGPLVLGRFEERTLRIVDANGYRSRNPQRVSPISLERSVTYHPGHSRGPPDFGMQHDGGGVGLGWVTLGPAVQPPPCRTTRLGSSAPHQPSRRARPLDTVGLRCRRRRHGRRADAGPLPVHRAAVRTGRPRQPQRSWYRTCSAPPPIRPGPVRAHRWGVRSGPAGADRWNASALPSVTTSLTPARGCSTSCAPTRSARSSARRATAPRRYRS